MSQNTPQAYVGNLGRTIRPKSIIQVDLGSPGELPFCLQAVRPSQGSKPNKFRVLLLAKVAGVMSATARCRQAKLLNTQRHKGEVTALRRYLFLMREILELVLTFLRVGLTRKTEFFADVGDGLSLHVLMPDLWKGSFRNGYIRN